jgi:DNA-binding CsgD family transcriptional regulator
LENRVINLNDAQKECLRLVSANLQTKQIARELNVSPHTVDQRLRLAIRALGVTNRFEAARALAAAEDVQTAYQPLIYQPETIAPRAFSDSLEPSGQSAEQPEGPWRRVVRFFSLPPLGGRGNDLSKPLKTLEITRIAFLSTLGMVTLMLLIRATLNTFG